MAASGVGSAAITTALSHSRPSSFSKLLSFSPPSPPLLRPTAAARRTTSLSLSLSLSRSLPIRCFSADSDEAPVSFVADPEEEVKDVYVEADGGAGGEDGVGGEGGGEGFGRGGGGGDRGEGEEEGSLNNKKMSMSQKLTLGYAALIAVGGLMGYIKSRSQKSLAAGGASALVLYFVYTQLPVRPAFASSLGLGLSAALLMVMGSRFRNSGKIFPAGVVSLVSLIMAGGYFHGILRSLHA